MKNSSNVQNMLNFCGMVDVKTLNFVSVDVTEEPVVVDKNIPIG